MRKSDSLNYLKSLGLPICQFKLFWSTQIAQALEYANYLRDSGYSVGLRTDLAYGEDSGMRLPFVKRISNEEIVKIFCKYGDSYVYILSESPGIYNMVSQGVVYLLPDLTALIYANEVDKCSCREAMEGVNSHKNVVEVINSWYCNPNDKYSILRAYLVRAFKKDNNIIGKRIEWSFFKKWGMVFWQLSDDESFKDIINNLINT